MKHRFYLGLTTLVFLLIFSTSSAYAVSSEFDITTDGNPTFHELDFLEKGGSYVDMNVEVLESSINNCSVFVIDNYQRDMMIATFEYLIQGIMTNGYGVYPWAEASPPTGTASNGLAYADLEPIDVYLGANNLTLGSKRTISGYLGPLSEEVYSTTTSPYDPNVTIVSTEYREYTYYVVLESSTAITANNPINPAWPLVLSINFEYAKVYVKLVSTLPAPSAVAAFVVLTTISFVIYKKKRK